MPDRIDRMTNEELKDALRGIITKPLKNLDEMAYNDFLDYATGKFILSLGRGDNVRDFVHWVIQNVIKNRKFGCQKQGKATTCNMPPAKETEP